MFSWGWEDSTFHLKVPLLLRLGHFSVSTHMAETATHAFCLDLLVGKNKFCCEKCPSSSSQAPDGSQQMCWMHICLLRTCWSVTFPKHVMGPPLGKHLSQLGLSARAKHQVPADWGSRLRGIPPSHISREERKSLFTEINSWRRPRSELWRASQELLLFSPQITLALPHLLLLSLCSHPAYPVVHIWGLSPGGMSMLMRSNALAPSLTQHGTCAYIIPRLTIMEEYCSSCS